MTKKKSHSFVFLTFSFIFARYNANADFDLPHAYSGIRSSDKDYCRNELAGIETQLPSL